MIPRGKEARQEALGVPKGEAGKDKGKNAEKNNKEKRKEILILSKQ